MVELFAMIIYQKQSLTEVPLNQLKLENIEILYILSELKEHEYINCKKACCYGASMNINILLTYLKLPLTISKYWCFSILSEVNQKTRGCLMFSEDIKGDQ